MNVHSDASYLSESNARSQACGHFFMGWSPKDGDPIKLNGAFFTLCLILRFVVTLAAETKLGALFLNCYKPRGASPLGQFLLVGPLFLCVEKVRGRK
jgi:hypothetical protein